MKKTFKEIVEKKVEEANSKMKKLGYEGTYVFFDERGDITFTECEENVKIRELIEHLLVHESSNEIKETLLKLKKEIKKIDYVFGKEMWSASVRIETNKEVRVETKLLQLDFSRDIAKLKKEEKKMMVKRMKILLTEEEKINMEIEEVFGENAGQAYLNKFEKNVFHRRKKEVRELLRWLNENVHETYDVFLSETSKELEENKKKNTNNIK